jgi:phage I-like protein
MLLTAAHALLPFATAGAPEWVHLVPAGTVRGLDGRGPYTLADPAGVIARSMQAGRLPIDENHSTDHALKAGGAAPARGWIVEMQAREDGIWGRVEWTPAGQALLEAREYRGISPVFTHTATDGEVLQLLRAALTNAPNLTQLTTLHTLNQETKLDLTALRRALGLPETADEAAIIAAAGAAHSAVATHTTALGEIARAAGLAEGAAAPAIVTALQTRAAAGDPAKMAADLVALQTQLTNLQQAQARAAAETAVDAAIRAGKPIPGSLRDHYIARHMQDPASVAKELDGLPSLKAGGLAAHAAGAGGAAADGLTVEDREAIALLGIDAEQFKKQRAREGAMVGSA